MNDTEVQLWKWHVSQYGEGVDIPATYRKLLEEIGELGEALMHKDDSAFLEAGDCAVLLLMILCGLNYPSLSTAMSEVLRKLETRRAEKDARSKARKEKHGNFQVSP